MEDKITTNSRRTFGSRIAHITAEVGYCSIRLLCKPLARKIYGDNFSNCVEEEILNERIARAAKLKSLEKQFHRQTENVIYSVYLSQSRGGAQ